MRPSPRRELSSSAFNSSACVPAAEHASGDLLARMDADDIAAPARIERQVALLESVPAMAACGTLIQYIPPEAVRNGARRYARWINGVVSHEDIRRDLFVECPLPHPTLVVRRAAYERVGRYQHVSWPEDYDLLLRLAEAGYRLGKVPEQLLAWREGPDRLSRVDERYSDTAFRRCKAYYLTRRIGDRPIVVWGAGPVGKAFARALLALDRSIAAFVDLDPRKIGQSIHGAPVIPPSAIEDTKSPRGNPGIAERGGVSRARGVLRGSIGHSLAV